MRKRAREYFMEFLLELDPAGAQLRFQTPRVAPPSLLSRSSECSCSFRVVRVVLTPWSTLPPVVVASTVRGQYPVTETSLQ
jgi:hypothetical protein